MAFPTAVNDQITDSVTQSNVQVIASAPGQAIGGLYQVVSSVLALASQNSTANQQNSNTISSAVTTNCVKVLIDSKESTVKK